MKIPRLPRVSDDDFKPKKYTKNEIIIQEEGSVVLQQIVYIVPRGSCYHKKNCRYVVFGTAIQESEAISKGKRACSFCKP